MRHISLFSGMGGFDLASEWMGWQNMAHCEINPFCLQILKYYWPNASTHTDIKTTDFTIYRGKCDILTGGFPCQPYSVAGQRKGKEDDRHLWPHMLRAIQEVQPVWVVGENVSGLINWNGGMVFDEVQADLEAAGYEVVPFILPACGLDAPHKRERIWFVAYASKFGRNNRSYNRDERYIQTFGERQFQEDKPKWHRWKLGSWKACTDSAAIIANAASIRQEPTGDTRHGRTGFKDGCCNESYAYTDSTRLQERNFSGQSKERAFGNWRNHATAGNWQNFPTQPPVCSGDDGLSAGLDGITFSKWRNESIKAAGNSIVPQVCLQIFRAIEEFNKTTD